MMSWVQSLPCNEDVFDEDMDELSVQNREWRWNMEKRTKEGFRDGSDAGKEASLQIGFNLGYREGAVKMKTVGQLKGIVSALQHWCQPQPSFDSVPITQLLRRVEKYEEDLFKAMQRAQELAPPSVKEVVEDLEDLGVEHSDGETYRSCKSDGNGQGCKNDGQRECCGWDKDASLSSHEVSTESVFVKGDTLEQLLHTCMELVIKMGLPEDLKIHIQQLRCT